MKTLLAALVLTLCLCPTAKAQNLKTLHQDLADELGPVDLTAGITQAQAGAVARYYGQRYIAACGAVDAAVDRGATWEIVPHTGVAGTADPNKIVVGKHTGKVAWGHGPTLNLPDLLDPTQIAPKPINAGGAMTDPASGAKVRIQFVVLPNGSVAHARFKRSSSDMKCDQRARGVVEGWRFPPRERPIELIVDAGCAR